MSAVDRWAADPSRPTPRQFWHDLARRALAPAAGLWAVVVATGLLVVGPLDELPAEDAAVRAVAAGRTPTLDTVTWLWSAIGATEFIVGGCLAAVAALWWRTRQWWFAVVPAIAVAVQAVVFMASALVVARPRPEVPPLDVAPPTSSFPSGHVGASTAFYVVLALLSRRIAHPVLRRLAVTACLLVPAVVAYARLYRGMHHPTDLVVGLLNGLVCAALAWRYLRRAGRTRRRGGVPGPAAPPPPGADRRRRPPPTGPAVSGPGRRAP